VPVEITATRGRRWTHGRVTGRGEKPDARGPDDLAFESTTSPRDLLAARRMCSPSTGSRMTRTVPPVPPSASPASVNSTITTASRPGHRRTGHDARRLPRADLEIRVIAGSDVRDDVERGRRVSAMTPARSAARTAYPSIAELSNGATSMSETAS
jgi:hypothetical protein